MTKIEKALKDLHRAQAALTAILVDDDKVALLVIERMVGENLKNARAVNEAYGLMYHQQNS